MKRSLLVFLKLPLIGRVKTRLAASVGPDEAVKIYRWLVDQVFARLVEVPVEEVVICYDPPTEESSVREWLAANVEQLEASGREVRWQAQVQADLGGRMRAGFEEAFARGAERVAAIGSDCIDLEASLFEAAWHHLEDENVVFGPTPDGGYYLIALPAGLRSLDPLFEGIPWSTEETLARSLQQVEGAAMTYALLPPRDDVDTIDDWRRMEREQFYLESRRSGN